MSDKPSDKKTNTPKREKALKTFLLIYIPIFVITLLIISVSYKLNLDSSSEYYELTMKADINSLKSLIENEMSSQAVDLLLLANHREVQSYLNDRENYPKITLEDDFRHFIETKKKFDQARLIDAEGMEDIRVNLTDIGAYLVSTESLQDKSDRYYYKDAITLDRDTIYLSPFDLNIEDDEIEKPIKPMIRLATPVFDSSDTTQGIIILNYLGVNILDIIDNATEAIDSEMFLLNQDGYYLKGSKPEDEWAFMYDEKSDISFAKDHPGIWNDIRENREGQIYATDGFYTFTKIHPLEGINDDVDRYSVSNKDYHWIMVNFIPVSLLYQDAQETLLISSIISIFLLLVLGTISWSLASSIRRRRIINNQIRDLNRLLKVINKTLRHDILNHLTAIKFNSQVYREEKKEKYLDKIDKSTEKSINFIHKMKRLEVFGEEGRFIKVYADNAIKKVTAHFTDIKINIKGKASIEIDGAFDSLIENIIRNSIRHGKASKIDVSIQRKGNTVKISIADNGKGIPRKIQKDVFKEGFKYGETGHSGIGLYIVRETIQRYGGNVSIKDNKPHGVIIVLNLPAV